MIVYHQLDITSIDSILRNGLKSSDTGSRSQDSSITKTDQLLDAQRPSHLVENNISRQTSCYAYISPRPGMVINIKDGSIVPVGSINKEGLQAVVKFEVDASRCFVSDLDLYDKIKQSLTSIDSASEQQALVHAYWNQLLLLADFTPGMIVRPEVMIPYDIPPQSIERLV